jgi:hypothetical protein
MGVRTFRPPSKDIRLQPYGIEHDSTDGPEDLPKEDSGYSLAPRGSCR